MPVIQQLTNLDDYFTSLDRKILLNDLSVTDSKLSDLIYTTCESEISMVPQCDCGELRNGYLIDKVCPSCNTTVIKPFENINPLLWIKTFDDNTKFLNPEFWSMLSKLISTKMDGVRWLADSSYNPPVVPPMLRPLKDIIGGRGYLNLINNLNKILLFLKNSTIIKTSLNKRSKLDGLITIYETSEDLLFSNYLPLINKKLFIAEKTATGQYNSILLADIIDMAVLAITSANDVDMSTRRIHNNTAKLISNSSILFTNYMTDMAAGKNGFYRKNIYGTRMHFSFRYVISSLEIMYDYDTVHVPWSVGLTTFRPHVINKLKKRGYRIKKIERMISDSTKCYHPVIDEILQELIDESPYKGIPILANRNPTLLVGSIQRVFITKFKTNVRDETVNISILIAKAFNADFDGDELNFVLLLDNLMAELAESFAPHVNVPKVGGFKISGNLNLPSTSVITMMKYLNVKEPEVDDDPVYKELLEL